MKVDVTELQVIWSQNEPRAGEPFSYCRIEVGNGEIRENYKGKPEKVVMAC